MKTSISRVLIGRHLIFDSMTSPTCCNSRRKRTPVKYKKRQKAGFPKTVNNLLARTDRVMKSAALLEN